MKDDQRKGEELRSDDDDDDGLSFLLGLVFFSMVVVEVIISLSSVWGFGINPQVSWDMMMRVVKGEEDQTIEEGSDLW